MTTSERLHKLNEAIENWVEAKRNIYYNAEMLRDIEDGEAVQIEVTCKGRTYICYRIEGETLYSLVHNIVKKRLDETKAYYEKCKKELYETWKTTRGNI